MPFFSAAIITISDRCASGARPEDLSGAKAEELLLAAGMEIAAKKIVPDEADQIVEALKEFADGGKIDLVVTTGGTGPAPRDVTPEATLQVLERQLPGLMEAARAASLAKTKFAMLSRGVAGIRGRAIIVNLPGSPKAVADYLEVLLPVLPHAIKVLKDDPGH